MSFHPRVIAFGTVVWCCFSQTALAQTTTSAKDTALARYQLQQITITALRYPEQLLRTPAAMSIISLDEFQDRRGYGLDEALKLVPGVLAQSRYGNQDVRITIRGFGARGAGDRSNAGTSRGIRILLDGIPETEPDGRTSFDLVDLASAKRLEVMRSNAAAIWGNASGGVISISSVASFDAPFIAPQAIAGSYGLQRFGLQSGMRLGKSRLSLAASNVVFDGWRENSASERLLVQVSSLNSLNATTTLNAFLTGTRNRFAIPGPLTQQQFDTNPQQANSTYLQRRERRDNRLARIGVTLEHDGEVHGWGGTAFVEPKFLQRSERGTFRDFTRYHLGGNLIYRYAHALGAGTKGKLQVGMDEAYQDGAVLFYSLSPSGDRGGDLEQNKREGANSFGVFVQEGLSLSNRMHALLGVRYNNVTYYNEDFLTPGFSDQKSFARWTPKLGLTYEFSSSHSIYGNLAQGIEVPAGNETDPASTFGQDTVFALNPLLEPITSTTLEVGSKQLVDFESSPWLRLLSYDLAAYRITTANDIIPYRGGRFYFAAGETRRYGLELGANVEFRSSFSLRAAITYATSEYVTYQVDSVHYGNPGHFVDYSGNKVAGIPDLFYAVVFEVAPKFVRPFAAQAEMQGVGEYFVDDANLTTVPAYTLFNLTVRMRRPLRLWENLSFSGFFGVNNLAGEQYAASAFINPDVVNGVPVYLEPGLPRNYVMGLTITAGRE
jgi:iron complex outermembrane receptor protein